MSTTTNLNLTKPDIGSTGWGSAVNDNWDTLDLAVVKDETTGDVTLVSPTATSVPITIQAHASQSGDLLLVEDSSETALVTIEANGALSLYGPRTLGAWGSFTLSNYIQKVKDYYNTSLYIDGNTLVTDTSSALYIGCYGSGAVSFGTNNTERVVINGSGGMEIKSGDLTGGSQAEATDFVDPTAAQSLTTKHWVESNYVPKTGGTFSGAVTVDAALQVNAPATVAVSGGSGSTAVFANDYSTARVYLRNSASASASNYVGHVLQLKNSTGSSTTALLENWRFTTTTSGSETAEGSWEVPLNGARTKMVTWTVGKVTFDSPDVDMNGNQISNADCVEIDNTLRLTPLSTPPSSPSSGWIYMDDGTNTGDSNPHPRFYDGTSWNDM